MDFTFPTEVLTEGEVNFVVPKHAAFVERRSDYAPSKAPVFYNPAMELNRDMAVLALQVFQRSFSRELNVCEPLAGCGIRGLRFSKEVDGIQSVVVNDINLNAYRLMKFNVNINSLTHKVKVENQDANFLLSSHSAPWRRFDYIDIDPFGSPIPFVDSMLRALRNNGLFALTATDLGPLVGLYPKTCIRRYGGRPLHTDYCHELAIRLLIGAMARVAGKHDIGTKVMFSYSSRHYIRVFAKIGYGAKKADASLQQIGYILHCFKCLHRELSAGIFEHRDHECPECHKTMSRAGPLWVGEINSEKFVASMEKEAEEKPLRRRRDIRRLLSLIRDEIRMPVTYYQIHRICNRLSLRVPATEEVVTQLKGRGYKVVLTHFKPDGLMTNASAKIVIDAIEHAARLKKA